MNHSNRFFYYIHGMEISVKKAPVGAGIIMVLGPSLVWCSEYIGSGEVILATRTGAILGIPVLWAVITGIFLKFWIGMSGARYTVVTGEGMIDMISRVPGPKNWGVWLVLVAQFITAAIAIGSLASAAGIFMAELFGINRIAGGWIITIFAVMVSWKGEFKILKIVMSILVFIVILGVLSVALKVLPSMSDILHGLIPVVPQVPEWAIQEGVSENAWGEILPLIGWGAGGFASQVWYSYWILGAGYGMAKKDNYGIASDPEVLKKISPGQALELKKWIRVVYADSSVGMLIGIFTTVFFLIAGAGVLGKMQIAPDSESLASELSQIFRSEWGQTGAVLFIAGGLAALISTQIGQLAGWPRLLADAFRICIPGFARFKWKIQYRIFLVFFFISNMTIIYSLGYKPVYLVKLGAILDGLLLTPLQALWILGGLYLVQPRLFSKEVSKILKPKWPIAAGLLIGFIVFSYFCIYQIPKIL